MALEMIKIEITQALRITVAVEIETGEAEAAVKSGALYTSLGNVTRCMQ